MHARRALAVKPAIDPGSGPVAAPRRRRASSCAWPILASLLAAAQVAAAVPAVPPALESQAGELGPRWRLGPARLALDPTLSLGSHANRAGASLGLQVDGADVHPAASWLYGWGQAAYTYELSTLGIPGPGHQLFGALGLGFTFGDGRSQPGLPFAVGRRTHSIELRYEGFADTIGTSQLSGAVGYAWSRPERTVRVLFENDIFAGFGEDQFRTGALEASLHLGRLPEIWGVGLGFLAWTGSTPRPSDLGRHDVYDLSQRKGGEYSHGLLYAALFYRTWRLSVGWDSEAIRDFAQNGLHYLIDDGSIAPLAREDRFFVQIAWNRIATLY